MTSRFVSTGAIDVSTGASVPVPATTPSQQAPPLVAEQTGSKKANEWAAVQAQLETERQAREAKRKAEVSGENGGRSLFEVLEANKAAKQAAFEEANKISNQFRALDDDEIGFLEEVQQRKREEEERVRRETDEGLAVFRKKREAVEMDGEGEDGDGAAWKVGGKRRRQKQQLVGKAVVDVKKKKEETERSAEAKLEPQVEPEPVREKTGAPAVVKKTEKEKGEPGPEPPASKGAAAPKSKLGLVDYGSSDDDSD